jgi:membrane-associated PAP2 superfamily phosphatase
MVFRLVQERLDLTSYALPQIAVRQPATPFWLWHFWIPLLLSCVLLIGIELSGLDLWLADHWFALEGGQWAWRNHWISYDLIHHHGKQMIILIGLVVLSLIVLSFFRKEFRNWRAPMAYVLTTMALIPALIASSKKFSPVHCPWSLTRYGGDHEYLSTYQHIIGLTDLGHCFPSGHSSGGFILLAMYFAALPFVKRPALFLVPGFIVGCIFALGQQARGAHFLSHDIATLSLC